MKTGTLVDATIIVSASEEDTEPRYRFRVRLHQSAHRRALRRRERPARRHPRDATNLGLGRMALASYGVTRDKLIWTADAYIRPDTYKSALARIIDAHHTLPIATTWGDGTTSSSDRQFFRSAKRGDAPRR